MADNLLSPNVTAHPDSGSRPVKDVDTILPDGSHASLTPSGITAAPSAARSSVLEDSESALHPDPGTEKDFYVENNPFAFSPGQLNKLLNPKSLSAFKALGGLRGIARGIQTDVRSGLSVDETGVKSTISFSEAVDPSSEFKPADQHNAPTNAPFADRSRVYGRNVLPPKKGKSIWQLMYVELSEKVIILLSVAGVISLALGLYQTFGVERPPGSPPSVEWVEGVAITAAVVIVVVVGSHNNWQKEKAFVRLNTKKDDRQVKVIRSGKSVMINVNEILVGEVLHLEPGDLVPADGILIDGHDVKCDESSATGESDVLKKTAGDQVMRLVDSKHGSVEDLDPFIISGAKVLEGVGTYVCTSVGVNSSFGKIMMSVRYDVEATPLQKKLEGLAVAIAKLGGGASALMFFILLFRFVASLPNDNRLPTDKASSFMDLLVVAIAIIAVAVPEGLPLAVTLALAFATTKLLKENNLVRVLRACETMGNATTICSDKTGTLTTNKMTVVAGTFGSTRFTSLAMSADEKSPESIDTPSAWASRLPQAAKNLIVQSVAVNSTAFEGQEEGISTFIGSKTETALLDLARDHLGLQSLAEARANEPVVQMLPFDSSRKCMAAVTRLGRSDKGYRLLVKGASEILLGHCASRVNISTLDEVPLDPDQRQDLQDIINQYASRSLRTIGLVYQDYPQWPPAGMPSEDGHVKLESLLSASDLVFLGVVGIQDPVRPGVPEAVRKAQHAGVTVRMVTGDNVITAQAIATECGIFTGNNGIIMEGPTFRRLSDDDMNVVLPKLQVLARSSPEDKRILVTRLKALGETVAVTGDGTNDAPALKAADVGFSMGITGTEVAKEASAIVLMDDNFASIVTALKWGRAVNDAVQKFLQFQITVNITAVILAFITAMYDDHFEPVLKAVQLLWVNLIMDTFAALALATDPPTEKILDRPPQSKSAPLITINMWKMIIGQAIFQLVITIVLYFAGPEILSYDRSSEDEMLQLDTIIFNTFVWMQIFNEFNNRRLDNKFNILEGIHRNKFFIFINLLMVGLQVGIVFVGGRVFEIKEGGINSTQWAISIIVALICLPWGVLVRIFPDVWFEKIARIVGKPFVVVYRLLRNFFSSIGSLFKTKKTAKDTASEEVSATIIIAPPEEKGCHRS
ncbi:Calcium-transporting ATPase 2 [Colletotrichum orbiculare MAFF 240422]|uniref:Calcium-transporting ATPase n=1 Tax=Colletotrichum orbiculare (strain 104-T / ATCC 96160 / CBS 514.97 / LARS 414 / MAFF 240422) TaxID=1213857 RepID=N4VMG5_COLOR|nr:Calcium-transporting ATPase 2 [Colletotrichum orbiculare MAFF 240422]